MKKLAAITPLLLLTILFSASVSAKKPAQGISLESWASTYGIDLQSSDLSSDIDSDGLSLLQEYSMLLDPHSNHSSLPKLKIIEIKSNGKVSLSFPIHDLSQVEYVMESSTDLRNWEEINGVYKVRDGVQGLKSIEFNSRDKFRDDDRRFFRVKLTNN